MSGLGSRTRFQAAHLRFADLVAQMRQLDQREHDALLAIVTITVARLNADRAWREQRKGAA